MGAVVYVTRQSQVCLRLLESLRLEGKTASVVDVSSRPERIPELMKLTGGRRIVPVLVDGGRILVAPDGGDPF